MFYMILNEEQAKQTADVVRLMTEAIEAWGVVAAHNATLAPTMAQSFMTGPAASDPATPPTVDANWAAEAATLYVRAHRASWQAALEAFKSVEVLRDAELHRNPFGVTGAFTGVQPSAAPKPTAPAKAAAKPAAKTPAAPKKAAKPASAKAAAKANGATAPKPAKTTKAKAKAKAKPTAAKTTPRAAKTNNAAQPIATLLDAPRGAPDDLTQIKGIGPKLNDALHAMGIYHYWQIAALTQDEIAWINERLRFKDRIERERWVQQAKTLSADGASA